jgi:hypothetical protein
MALESDVERARQCCRGENRADPNDLPLGGGPRPEMVGLLRLGTD